MSDAIAWLAGCYNWPFLLTLGIGVLFILADVFLGGVSDLIGLDADADVDVDMDVDVDIDLDVDVATTLGFDAGSGFHGPDPDVGAHHAGGLLMNGLAWIGLGKVPISVLLEVMLLTFGSTGLIVNAIAGDLLPAWGSYFSFPIALVCAIFVAPVVTKMVGSTIARVVPADATTSRKATEFLNETGVTASTVTTLAGQVKLSATDKHPPTIINVRLKDGGEPLARDVEVLLIEYDAEKNTYLVVPTSSLEL